MSALPKIKVLSIEVQLSSDTAPNGNLNHFVSTITCDKVHKKTKALKSPQWSDVNLEIPVSSTEKDLPELTVRISGKPPKKGLNLRKIILGTVTIGFEVQPSKCSPYTTELNLDLTSESEKFTGKIRIKLELVCVKTLKPRKTTTMSKSFLPEIFSIIKEKNIEALRQFLKENGPDKVNVKLPRSGNSPLHEACIEREEQLLNTLLMYPEVNVNLKNEDENTPLHYFCAKWTSPDYLTSFKLFMDRGAEVNAKNSNGETPIFKAIFNNSIRALLMEALIERGANLNIVTKNREGLLHYAVRLNRADLVRLILQNRPSLDLNSSGETPDSLAFQLNGSAGIKKYLQQISELFKWLDDNDLGDLKGIFIKSEITVNLLPDMNDALLAQIGVDKIGTRMKVLKACEKEKELSKLREQPGKDKPKKDELPGKVLGSLEDDIRGMEIDAEGLLDGSQIEYTKHLGTGAAGDVYKGLYNGSVVAIKVLSVKSAEREVEEFKKEFEILRAVRNANVVKFVGVAMKPLLCMVMEYCARGSLHHALKDQAAEVNWSRAIGFCRETCAGLNALHTNDPVILHRDLKSLNLLVTQDWRIKIADFGLSRFQTEENLKTMQQMRGTSQYIDPEVINGGTFKPPSDIYSMSIIFWEIVMRTITGSYHQPYGEYKNLQFDYQIIVQASKEDLRPTIHPSCPASFKELIVACWNKQQVNRPALTEIMERLEGIDAEYRGKQAEWDALRTV